MGLRAEAHIERVHALLQHDLLGGRGILVRDLVGFVGTYFEALGFSHNVLHALRVVAALALAVRLAVVLIAAVHFDGPRRVGPDRLVVVRAPAFAAAVVVRLPFVGVSRDDGLDHGRVPDDHGDEGFAAGPDCNDEAVGLSIL